MELEAVIGLEVHVQLKTKSKMFCQCANILGAAEPNSAICPICLGYPGTLPVPNGQAIKWTQRAGVALNCELARVSKFDRKSYFYPDLPKGYQISQFDQPFCGKGGMEIVVGGRRRVINITRIHLEEDAAKNIHKHGTDYMLVDYNRAGTPLMEIVTEPDFRSPDEAKVFLQELRKIMRILGISDADMEKGQLRCDANISLREPGERKLYEKTEIKNLNSFKFVEKALKYEIKRQSQEWKNGEVAKVSSTRGYEAKTGRTVEHRAKERVADYRYFPEPDIPSFEFSADDLSEAGLDMPELPLAKVTRLMRQNGISAQDAELLVARRDLSDLFEATVSAIQQLDEEQTDIASAEVGDLVKLVVNIILREVRELVAETSKMKIRPTNLAELVVMVKQGRINKAVVGQVLLEMKKTGGDPDQIIDNLGLEQISGADDIDKLVDQVIAENKEIVQKIKAGKDAGIQYLMGQVMAKSKGKANPKEVMLVLRAKIS